MKHIRWEDVVAEELNPLASRRVLHTEQMTVARLQLAKGAVVERHSHGNEQISSVERGVLRFEMGDRAEVVMVRAGESFVIPPDLPHRVVAEEDTEVTDVFAPRREDWLRGEDAYLR